MSLALRSITVVPADRSGCGYYRLMQWAHLLQIQNEDVSIMPPGKWRAVPNSTVVWTQRITTEDLFVKLIGFKQTTKQKFIVDYDDMVWTSPIDGTGLPEYNICREKINAEQNLIDMKKYLNILADVVTVSTERIKENLKGIVPEEKIVVLPNMLSYKDWFFPFSQPPKENIFYFAGSHSHFDNVNKKQGDFSTSLIQYLSGQTVMNKSLAPYFLKPVKSYPGCSMALYPPQFYQETRNVRFIIAPLADNEFNRNKSDLKYLESAAVGRVCLVNDFPGSPYAGAHPYQKIPCNATPQTIKYIVDRANEHYGEILKYQWDYLNRRWANNHLARVIQLLS